MVVEFGNFVLLEEAEGVESKNCQRKIGKSRLLKWVEKGVTGTNPVDSTPVK